MHNTKTAETKYDVLEFIKQRWSPRSFRDEKINLNDLNSLFEAMSWAASARNEQPWRLIVGLKDEGGFYDKIFHCLDEWNQKWAHTAPVLAIVIAKKNINGKPNPSYAYDCGAAMATLCLQAISKDIFVHQMGGINAVKVYDAFEINPEEYQVMTGVAIGRLGNPEDIDKHYHEMETASRHRKSLEDFVLGEHLTKTSKELF